MRIKFVLRVLVLLMITSSLAVYAAFDVAGSQRFWRYSSPEVILGQTGRAANKQSPECGEAPDGIKAVEVLARAGASAVDTYLQQQGVPAFGGYGITAELLTLVNNDGNRQWLSDRFGLNGGLSRCATQCVLYPAEQQERLSIFGCISETGGNGLDCGVNGWDGEYRGVYNLSHARTGSTIVSCMTGKNWSHNRDRRFWVVAADVNPLSGQRLDKVYR